jgi:hypothetical protein
MDRQEAAMTQGASDSDRVDLDNEVDQELTDIPLDESEMLDSDDLGSTDEGRDPLDDGWSPPDRPSRPTRRPTTPREDREGPSLDRLLAEELPDPDPYLEAERRESGAVLDADVYGPGSTVVIDDFPDGEDERVAGLVASDEGVRRPQDPEMLGRATGEAPGGGQLPPPAEEDALHLDRFRS